MANPLMIAARLYTIRETAKTLLGDRFHAEAQKYNVFIEECARVNKISILEAAQMLARTPNLPEDGLMMVLAAAVELIEPSKGVDRD